jgi:hypothetical protein
LPNPAATGNRDPFEHAVKDEIMGRKNRMPVENAGQTPREKTGGLLQAEESVIDLGHGKFESGQAGELHLCDQKEAGIFIKLHHSPEIDGIAKAQVEGATSAALQADPTDKAVGDSP